MEKKNKSKLESGNGCNGIFTYIGDDGKFYETDSKCGGLMGLCVKCKLAIAKEK